MDSIRNGSQPSGRESAKNFTGDVSAQHLPSSIERPEDAAGVFAIYPGNGVPPGSEQWTWHEQTMQVPLKAGKPVELHIFSEGEHGFGMKKQQLPSDQWIDLFKNWMAVQGYLSPARKESAFAG